MSAKLPASPKSQTSTKKNLDQPKIDASFKLRSIVPLTDTQKKIFNEFDQAKNLVLMGTAGTGKTFCSMYLALKSIVDNKNNTGPNKIIIIRSVVSSRDVGFLPGTLKEKLSVYEAPYKAIFSELLGRGDAWEIMKTNGVVDFVSTSYLRGTSINDSFIIMDEFQNCNLSELDTIMTRVGKNSRMIFCGDLEQTDLLKSRFDVTGLPKFVSIIEQMQSFNIEEFGVDDIVRSGIVREYILAKRSLGIGCVLE
jgi:phosphate starvation-inducible PhoH-like protein